MSEIRYNPLTGQFNPQQITNELHTIAWLENMNAYGIRLTQSPQRTNPSSVTVVDNSTTAPFTEQLARISPSANQFWVDYEGDAEYGTGVILFNPADNGKTVRVSYKGLGKIIRLADIVELQQAITALQTAVSNAYGPHIKIGGDVTPNATNPNTHLDITAGLYATDDRAAVITLPAWTINCNAAWSAGNNQGKLVGASSLSPNSTYHVFAISNSDGTTVDYCVSTSLNPTLPTGFTRKRRITSRTTDGSANLIRVIQRGDYHLYETVRVPINGVAISTSGALYSLGTPAGIRVLADIVLSPGEAAYNNTLAISLQNPDQQSQVPNGAPWNSTFRGMAGGALSSDWDFSTATQLLVYTNTSSQIAMRRTGSYSSPTYYTTVQLFGYYDDRNS
jgi:hypothetical protein